MQKTTAPLRAPTKPVFELKGAAQHPDFPIRLTFLLISICAQLNVYGKKQPSLRELAARIDEDDSKFLTHEQLQSLFKHEVPDGAPYVQHTPEDIELLALFLDPYKPLPQPDETKFPLGN